MRSAQELAVARSIWPTGKPAEPLRSRGLCDCYYCMKFAESPLAPARTRGIAEGRRLARAMRCPKRRGRWLDWLREKGACRDGFLFAGLHLSPEEAVLAASRSQRGWEQAYVYWLAVTEPTIPYDIMVALGDARGPRESTKAAERLLASPEWAALLWQREGGR